MLREVPVMWLRLAERCARASGAGAGAAAHAASANAARKSRSGRVRKCMARRAHGRLVGAVTAQLSQEPCHHEPQSRTRARALDTVYTVSGNLFGAQRGVRE